MNLEVLYEDKNILVINKPSGLVIHADGKTHEPSVVDWILEKYPEMKEVGEPWENPQGETIYRPGIVHRLDRETSGVLVIAKNQKTFEYLKSLFQTREVSKVYNAFVYGIPKEKEVVIDRPIARSRKDFRLWSAQRGARGAAREAVTYFTVLKTGSGAHDAHMSIMSSAAYLEVRPETGRTHQIRVHLKAINHPVVCDRLYAPKRPPILGFERLALHATSIQFKGPDGQSIKVEAPLPADFQRALAEMAAGVLN